MELRPALKSHLKAKRDSANVISSPQIQPHGALTGAEKPS